MITEYRVVWRLVWSIIVALEDANEGRRIDRIVRVDESAKVLVLFAAADNRRVKRAMGAHHG